PAIAAAPFPNGIQAFTPAGFQVGTDARVNIGSKLYFWAAFRDVPALDLAVEMSPGDSTPNEGEAVSATISLRNMGPETATGVSLRGALAPGFTYQTYLLSRGVYDPSSGIWNPGSIASGYSATLTL